MDCGKAPNEVPGLIPLAVVIVAGMVTGLYFAVEKLGRWAGSMVWLAGVLLIVGGITYATLRKPKAR